ncbi:ATP-binding cassette domain-containing protein [Jiella pelagia]|uniref:ATP-binding cassette domain-containing protein n=1 Tax=Jiella pelagia TaxID=2986949 RepID=A0ABY7C6C3_9HYPH|nr:ATP-binding cassette domain-containing protein [Jiella pelagia]WAP71147.1 ATP-binding cassette domain-containing protein [Jiella pelagia]
MNVGHVYETASGTTEALTDISFRVETGRFVSIVGPSGCGKSSLLMMIAGLVQPTRGTITAGGRPLVQPDPTRIGVGREPLSLAHRPVECRVSPVASPRRSQDQARAGGGGARGSSASRALPTSIPMNCPAG